MWRVPLSLEGEAEYFEWFWRLLHKVQKLTIND